MGPGGAGQGRSKVLRASSLPLGIFLLDAVVMPMLWRGARSAPKPFPLAAGVNQQSETWGGGGWRAEPPHPEPKKSASGHEGARGAWCLGSFTTSCGAHPRHGSWSCRSGVGVVLGMGESSPWNIPTAVGPVAMGQQWHRGVRVAGPGPAVGWLSLRGPDRGPPSPLPGLYGSSRGIFPEQALPAAAQMNQVIATWKYFVLIKRRAQKQCSSTRAGTDEGVPGAYGDRNPADLRLKAELVMGSWEPGRGTTLEPGVWRGEPLVEAPRCLAGRGGARQPRFSAPHGCGGAKGHGARSGAGAVTTRFLLTTVNPTD